ncbi:MAG: T9SS type A sorting domain-containing protein, partial [Saprospiraceae bacterium]|nr:T9SS type A sorting domain-containing protein [Saprospiraceae bacterium]
ASQNSLLEFDLALLRNQTAQDEGYDYSSMFQVKWGGAQAGQEIVYDQEEGDVVHHNYNLPANFKGEVLFSFYTELGQWELNEDNFATDDFVLLDNLHFSPFVSDTKEEKEAISVQISPNPTSGKAMLTAGNETINSLIVSDLSGKLIRRLAVNSTSYLLDLGTLPQGFYSLQIQMANGQFLTEKVVKF